LSISAEDFEKVQKFLIGKSGISLAAGKEYLVEGRLEPLVKSEGFGDIHRLVASLNGNPESDLGKKVVEALTTNETSFFRDRHPFETLKSSIIPELLNNTQAEKQIHIWSAACSSGQEPYSLAMLLADSFSWATDWEIKITASDISEEMLEKCRLGLFSQFEISRGLPAHYLPRFLQRAESQWQIKLEVRERIDFRYLNLYEEWRDLPRLDIAFMRNVLIYFDKDTKTSILTKMMKVLKPGGYLFLGSGETPVGLEDRFQPADFSTSSCFKLLSA
jgi:chemotaxis protein methyltransferase CheR